MVITTFDLQASSSPAEGNGGLFNSSMVCISGYNWRISRWVFIVSRKLNSFVYDDDLSAADAYGSSRRWKS